MKKILLSICALIVILGAALTVYVAPASEPGHGTEIVSSNSECMLYSGGDDQYDHFSTGMTPNLDVISIVDEAMQETNIEEKSPDPRDYFEVNELGLTYGPNIYRDVTPDLVAAIGLNGADGYVYWEELLGVGARKSPDDVVTDVPSSIPLYASDGVTVIGEFPVGPRNDDVQGTWGQ